MVLTKIRTVLFVAIVLGTINVSFAQEEDTLATKRLNEVVIRSQRTGGQITRMRPIQGTNIWSGKKNEVIQVANMDANLAEKTGRQIFAKVPGVFVYDMDGSGNQVNISTRGLDPHRGWEFNLRKNGVITNSDMYGYPASHYSLPMEAVERIEMVRGTGSLQYGAQFGGMVNYITKRADTTKAFGFESVTTAGSYGLLSSYNAVGGQVGKLEYYAYYQKRVSDGYRENASSKSDAQSLLLIWKPTTKFRLTGEFARSTYTFRIPGPLTDAMFQADPRQSTRSRSYFNPDIYIPSITADWTVNPNTKLTLTTSAVLGARNSVTFDRPADVADAINPATGQYAPRQVDIDNFNSYTAELRMLHHYTLFNKRHSFTSGVQLFNNDLHRRNLGKGTTGTDFNLGITEPGFGRDLHFKTKNIALFIENSFNVTDKLSVNPGIRFETGKSDMSGTITYYDPGNLPNSISHQFPLLGLNAQYQVNAAQNLYAGWSQSYRPVIFKDIIPASVYEVVDKNLSDAQGSTFEFGYRGQSHGFNWDVGGFRMLYNNRLGSLAGRDASNSYYLFRTNVGNSVTTGAEIYVEYNMNISKVELAVFTSTALFHARYTDASARVGEENVSIRGNKVETVPDVISRNGITLRWNKATLSGLYSYTAESFADALNTATPSANGAVGLVPSYSLLDLNASYAFSRNFSLKVNVSNVTNEQYFTKRPSFYPGPGVWASDGRTWSMMFSVKI
jgi:Fe(3+) dicitrate transport protein